MYESFYKLTEKPFSLLPDPDFLYLSKRHGIALSLLEYGLAEQAGITVVSGEIGCGKTTLIRAALRRQPEHNVIGLISNTHKSMGDLLQWVLLAFGLEHKNKGKVAMFEDFGNFLHSNFAQGKKTILIIDEAHNLDIDSLEELRLLNNINADKDQLLQLVLVGQPELRTLLRMPAMEQFAQRIAMDYFIDHLSFQEVKEYIAYRIKKAGGAADLFKNDALGIIMYHSSGVPRLINIICDTALIYGFAEGKKKIDAEIVRNVVRDRLDGRILPIDGEENALIKKITKVISN